MLQEIEPLLQFKFNLIIFLQFDRKMPFVSMTM